MIMSNESIIDPAFRPKRGRPSKFTLKLAEKICLVAQYGMTDKQICYLFDISEDTINTWKKSEVFKRKLDKAKDNADQRVKESLYNRAIGMKIIEKVTNRLMHGEEKDDKGNPNVLRVNQTLTEKDVPPDVQACRMWLMNRKPDEWKEKPIEVIADNRSLIIGNFNADQLAGEIINEFGEQTKTIARAVRDALGIKLEEDSSTD